MIVSSYSVDELVGIVGCTAAQVHDYRRRGLLRALPSDDARYSRLALGRLRLFESLRAVDVPVDMIEHALCPSQRPPSAGAAAACLADGVAEILTLLGDLVAKAQGAADAPRRERIMVCQYRLARAHAELTSCRHCTRSPEECDLCGSLGVIEGITRLILVNE